MQEKDILYKVVDEAKNIRLYLARTTALVNEACRRHETSATASAALGRVMTAAVMMASDLKGDDDILTLKINGQGPAGTVLATADSKGGVRGLISNPQADLPEAGPGKLAVGQLVGTAGFVEVIKDLGLKQPFSGQVPLVSGEIAEDVAQYYMISEQIPSLVSLGVLVATDLSVQAAGGIFVQALPDASDEVLEIIESNILALMGVSSLMDQFGEIEDILPLILKGINYRVVEKKELSFRCTCSRDRLKEVLINFKAGELGDLTETQDIEVFCNFCRERYVYSAKEIIGQ